MKKFGEIYKAKVNEAEIRFENKILDDFKIIYNDMLEHYGLESVHQLNEQDKTSFLTELNIYWSEEEGLSEKGEIFLEKRTMTLNENSTATQKKNFLRDKSYAIINETLRQSDIKYKLYDIIDEMYKQLNASSLNDILTPDTILTIISESFNRSVVSFKENMFVELKESAKPKRKYIIKK